jgi:hypothetical protein
MSNSEIFLISFSIFAIIASMIVYNTDFSKWEKKHSHD